MKIIEGNEKIALPLKDTKAGDVIAIRLGTGKIVLAVIISDSLETGMNYGKTRLLIIGHMDKTTKNITKTENVRIVTLKTESFECIVITKAKEFAQNTMLQCWLDFDDKIPNSWNELTSYEKMIAKRTSTKESG